MRAAGAVWQDGRPMNKTILLQTIIPVVVPVAIAALKQWLPRLPKAWLPVLAPVLGAGLDILTTHQVGAGTALGAALGAAGVGLREIVDQLRKALAPSGGGRDSGDGPSMAPPGSPFTPLLVVGLMPWLWVGCQTPDEAAFKTAATLEATVEHAMSAWADYALKQRAATPPDAALPEQEDNVRAAHHAFRLAMGAVYAGRAAVVEDQTAGLPVWQTQLDAARAASDRLVMLVDLFVKPRVTSSQSGPSAGLGFWSSH